MTINDEPDQAAEETPAVEEPVAQTPQAPPDEPKPANESSSRDPRTLA